MKSNKETSRNILLEGCGWLRNLFASGLNPSVTRTSFPATALLKEEAVRKSEIIESGVTHFIQNRRVTV